MGGGILIRGHALSTPFGALKHGGLTGPQDTSKVGHALSTPFGALKRFRQEFFHPTGWGACPLNALRGTETRIRAMSSDVCVPGHALSTPFGALKH